MPLFAEDLVRFYKGLTPPLLPNGFGVLYPQQNRETMAVVQKFFHKYFNDERSRRLILGINPGRFGAGITGINFTAPRQLTENCHIDHVWGNTSELSAEFIYEVIDAYGGPTHFYSDFFIGAVSPLGFIKEGKNINYYDDKSLQEMVTPFIVKTLQQQMKMRFLRDACFCIGGEKNYKFLQSLNDKYGFFENIYPLPHPRFIMQYRRKRKQNYIDEYITALAGKIEK